jgi:sugar lactone lactonase YvrE
MRTTLGLIGWVLTLFVTVAIAQAFEVTGLSTPESFIVDPETGDYYISNVNGEPTGRDNNGFITKLDKTGKVVALKFIEGSKRGVTLDAPKGLDVIGDSLYVTDVDVVHVFNKGTGNLVGGVEFRSLGARFLNDLTHDDQGNLYVSDTAVFVDAKAPGTIFKIETKNEHKASVLVRDPALGAPNGLAIHPKTKRLLANTWGDGKILEITPEGRINTLVQDPAWKDLDGLDYDNAGNLYTASFTGGTIYKIASDKKIQAIKSDLTTPADINLDRKGGMILVPSFNGNTAMTFSIGP